MSLWIQLDRPHAHFTNLDFITGKVVFYLKYETSVSAISVKLEGECRTRLAGPRPGHTELDDNRRRTEYEEHKFTDFKFLPIEPPRAHDRHEETFARRQQHFTRSGTPLRKNSLFKTSPQSDEKDDTAPPQFQIDARLPNPPVITCNEPLPLRILVQRLDQSLEPVSLQVLQIELIGYTHVRAHDLARTESGTWLLVSKSNMNMQIPTLTNAPNQEWKVPAQLWDNIPLPNTVAPSFDTCNISRTYELDVRVGLSHGAPEVAKPELIVIPLRLSVTVYSGVTPPQALLNAAAPDPQSHRFRQARHNDYHEPSTPSQSSSFGEYPSQIGSYDEPPPFPDDAPPSYEDALADDIAPFDGPRRDYNPPPSSPVVPVEKGSGVSRRVSERLFASNNIGQRPTWSDDAPPPMPPRPTVISEESTKKDQA
ncbi:MAG: hypothetical protein Q9160_005038 [Pyrenula sp. 1 TL-2023]